MDKKWIKVNGCHLSLDGKWCRNYTVRYPLFYEYHNGLIIDGKRYNGLKVNTPVSPKGFKLVKTGCGYDYDRPLMTIKYQTAFLIPTDNKKYTKAEIKNILDF